MGEKKKAMEGIAMRGETRDLCRLSTFNKSHFWRGSVLISPLRILDFEESPSD